MCIRDSINTDVKMGSNCEGGKGWQTFTFQSGIDLSKWHHLVLAYKGSGAITYIDGVEINVKTGLPAARIDDCPGGELKFGVQAAPFPNYFTGFMDDVRVYNRQLSAGEVRTLFSL